MIFDDDTRRFVKLTGFIVHGDTHMMDDDDWKFIEHQMVERDALDAGAVHSQLLAHARAEFERCELDETEFPNDKLLELVRVFAAQGHSESSAHWTRHMFDFLARYQALPATRAMKGTVDDAIAARERTRQQLEGGEFA